MKRRKGREEGNKGQTAGIFPAGLPTRTNEQTPRSGSSRSLSSPLSPFAGEQPLTSTSGDRPAIPIRPAGKGAGLCREERRKSVGEYSAIRASFRGRRRGTGRTCSFVFSSSVWGPPPAPHRPLVHLDEGLESVSSYYYRIGPDLVEMLMKRRRASFPSLFSARARARDVHDPETRENERFFFFLFFRRKVLPGD